MNVQNELETKTPYKVRIGNVRWFMVTLLCIGAFINYVDRANVSIAAPAMMKQIHLTATDIGLMGSVFGWIYAFGQLPSGWLIDRFGSKKVYSIAVVWWSLATAATGLCNKVGTLLTVRGLMGVGEAPAFPTSAKIVAKWFPEKERGLANGLWDGAIKLAPAIAVPVLVGVQLALGWRWLFYLTGIVGVVFVAFFAYFYKNPENHANLSKVERDYIHSDSTSGQVEVRVSKMNWVELYKFKSMWGIMLGYFCNMWIFNIFLYFLPLYLLKTQHISFKSLGIYASVPWVGAFLGDVISGYISKKITDKGKSTPKQAKKLVIVVSAIVQAILVISLSFSHGLVMSITIMTVALAFNGAVTCHTWALSSDLSPSDMVASTTSLQNFGGYLGGATAPLVTGIIVDSTGSYSLAFLSGGIIIALAAFFYGLMVNKPIHKVA